MGAPLSPDRLGRFLQGRLLARVALVTGEGQPYVVPVWYHWDGQALWFVGRERSEWCQIVDRSPVMAAVVDAEGDYVVEGERFFTPRATFRGVARVVERPGEGTAWVPVARAMAERYRGQAGLDYLGTTLTEGRWLIRLDDPRVTSWEGGGWAARYRTSN